MFKLSALISIMIPNIILVLALVIIAQKENSVFGHAWSKETSRLMVSAKAA